MRLLAPLQAGLRDPAALQYLLLRLGWDSSPDPKSALGVADLAQLLEDLESVAAAGDGADQLSAISRSALAFLEAVRKLRQAPPALPPPLGRADFWTELVDWLLLEYLERDQPLWFSALLVTGLARLSLVQPEEPGRVAYERRTLSWQDLPRLVTGLPGLLRERYRFGDPQGLDADLLVRTLERAALSLGLAPVVVPPRASLGTARYDPRNAALPLVNELVLPLVAARTLEGFVELGLLLLPVPPEGKPGDPPRGLYLSPVGSGEVRAAVPLVRPFTLHFGGAFTSDAALGVELQPGSVRAVAGPGATSVAGEIALRARPDEPWLLAGARDGSRAELSGLRLALSLLGSPAAPELQVALGTGLAPDAPRLRLVLQPPPDDGFLSTVFDGRELDLSLAADLAWSSRTGLSLNGDASLSIAAERDDRLGFLRVTQVGLALRADGGGPSIAGTANAALSLGPVDATIEGVGFSVSLAPRQAGQPGGTFGDLELHSGFLPPRGVGLSVSAGAVSGGGFLGFDSAQGRYSGALHLRCGELSLDAIGLLDTRLPGGQPGFSLLALITADLPPIQLGLGFTLDGVGGLLALERTFSAPALQAAVRSHALDDVLFPRDVLANAPHILGTLSALFPPAPGHFVFGPMLRLGWGTPRIVDAELALLFELPGPRLAVLGEVNAAFPALAALPVVELHCEVVGVLDLPASTFALDASLHDSRIAGFLVAGDFALRMAWGDAPSFALSVGGFHPHFAPPAGFPQLRRFTVALTSGDNPRLSLEAYLALTSNSVQFGARAELSASFGLTVYGVVAFDALFILSPFSFEVDLAGAVSLRAGDFTVASVHFAGHLSGPNPWHLHGEAGISFFFFDLSVNFDVSFGDAQKRILPAADPWSDLQRALADPRSYTPILASSLARVTSSGAAPSQLFEPAGGLRFTQQVAPFDRALTRYGSGAPAGGAQTFLLSSVTLGATQLAFDGAAAVKESGQFAPGQFSELTAEEKLSSPSFVAMTAGFAALADAVTAGSASAPVPLIYQSWLARGAGEPVPLPDPPPLSSERLDAAARHGAATRGPLRRPGLRKYLPDPDLGLERTGGIRATRLSIVELEPR